MAKKPKSNYTTEAGKVNMRDLCWTPDYALDPVLAYVPKEWVIWEPARGDGYIENPLKERGYTVVSGDLMTDQNYFDDRSVPEHYDMQLTNPPFSLKKEWVERAYALGKPWALVMPTETLGAGRINRMFEKYGMEILIPDKRIDFGMPNIGFEKSSSQFPSAWYTWGLNIGRDITYVKLVKGKQRERRKMQLPMFSEESYTNNPMFGDSE